MRLTPSQRLVLYYMAFETVYHRKLWLTFEDLQRGTGLAVRTLRSALVSLRKAGYIESLALPGEKRLLHRIRIEKLLPEPELEGLYLVDIAGDVLTPDALAVLTKAEVVLYTESISVKKLENIVREAKLFNGEVPPAKSVAIVFNSLLDWDKVTKLAPRARYICASNLLDKALGVCLTCGDVDIDLRTIRIKSPGPDLEKLLTQYDLVGTVTVDSCGGRKAELIVLKKKN
ncbi:MAG: helix-turn-helix domain-containing protein [Pyrobaculum sp.]